jgi:hypothetical protein
MNIKKEAAAEINSFRERDRCDLAANIIIKRRDHWNGYIDAECVILILNSRDTHMTAE